MVTTDTNRNHSFGHILTFMTIANGLYDCIMTYGMQPGVILIPDACLGIQNGFQYCHILYCFQLSYIITLSNGKKPMAQWQKNSLTRANNKK